MKILSAVILSVYVTSALAQEIVVENEPEPGHGYRMGTVYVLHCQGTLRSGCSIEWWENDIVLDNTRDRIEVTARPGSYSYVCKFLCTSGLLETQSRPQLLTGQNLIRVEVLNSGASGVDWRPLENSAMEFSCHFEMLSFEITADIREGIRPTFEWMVDGNVVGTQQTYSFTAVPGYDANIQCKATYNTEELTSAAVSVTATDEVEDPDVVFMQDDDMVEQRPFITGAGYTAHCVSRSHSAEAIYLWTKDYFAIPNTLASRTFELNSANGDSDDGVYRCRMRLQENEYCSKSSVAMQVEAVGRFCQSETDCLAGDEYTSICRNSRCECAPGFSPRGDICAGMTPLLASGFLIVCAIIVIRLL